MRKNSIKYTRINGEVQNLNLRNTPEIRFILDESIEYGVNMSKLIDDVTKKDASAGKTAEEE